MADETTHDVDQLLADIEKPASERSMTAEPETAETAPEPQAKTWNGEEWGFESGGRRVVPDSPDKIKTWMSQGYNYSQKMGDLNRTHTQRMSELDSKYKGYDLYAEVDSYAKKNKDWWQFVEQQWNQRNQPRIEDPNVQKILQPFAERLQTTESVLQQWQEEKRVERERHEDEALTQEIDSIRKTNPTIDFNSQDASGKTLEYRVMKHADDNGIPSFRAAFRDYMHDKLMELAKANSREAVVKGQERAAKSGVLGKTLAPTKGLQPAQNLKAKSWDALAKEALAELGVG